MSEASNSPTMDHERIGRLYHGRSPLGRGDDESRVGPRNRRSCRLYLRTENAIERIVHGVVGIVLDVSRHAAECKYKPTMRSHLNKTRYADVRALTTLAFGFSINSTNRTKYDDDTIVGDEEVLTASLNLKLAMEKAINRRRKARGNRSADE